MRKYIGTREARELLGVSEATIYRLIKQKKIPSIKLGGSWRIPIQDLEKTLGAEIERDEPWQR